MSKPRLLVLPLGTTLRDNDSAGGKIHCYYVSKLEDKYDMTILCKLSNRERTLFNEKRLSVPYIFTNDRPPSLFARCVNKFLTVMRLHDNFPFFCYLDQAAFVSKIKLLKKQGYNPDVVILDWTHCIVLAKYIKKAFPAAKIIGCEQDVSFLRFERAVPLQKTEKERKQAERICKIAKRMELSALSLLDQIDVLDEKDANLIPQFKEKIKIVAPYFDDYSDLKRTPDRHKIIFFGAMGRPENYECVIWFIENVFKKLPDDFSFTIVGGSPHPLLKQYESGRILLTGFVEDVRPYFADALCMVVPLFLGAGIKIKVLEAMSAGIPVLTNAIGIEGIPAKNGTEYVHCKTAEDYEKSILDLSHDGTAAERISNNARSLVKEHFDYTKCSYV
ncbi:MAG: glycosyltransferase [Treponema sp.]|nr:glycosyltransferase [Treponema sp.]